MHLEILFLSMNNITIFISYLIVVVTYLTYFFDSRKFVYAFQMKALR